MTALKQRMMADMKLHGLAPGTQRVYLKAVHRLAAHYMLAPDRLSHHRRPTPMAERCHVNSGVLCRFAAGLPTGTGADDTLVAGTDDAKATACDSSHRWLTSVPSSIASNRGDSSPS